MAVKTLKVTDAEAKLIDYLYRFLDMQSESGLIRFLVNQAAEQVPSAGELLKAARASRRYTIPRRSPKLARIIGQRRRGEKLKGGAA